MSSELRHRFVRVACLLLVALVCGLAAARSAHADCASENGCWCGDGNCPTLGCCGRTHQRVCDHTSVFSDCPSACDTGYFYNSSTTHCEPFSPDCSYCQSTVGNCCGGVGDTSCAGTGHMASGTCNYACKDGLELRLGTCQPPCSYCEAAGVCCGDRGQTSCAGFGGSGCNYDCRDGLRYEIGKGTCQPFDSSCSYCQSTFGHCCGGVGDLSCAGSGQQASGADCNITCKDGLRYNVGTGTCEEYECSYCQSKFDDSCCGDENQNSCAGFGGMASGTCNYACKDGLSFNAGEAACTLPQTAYSHDATAGSDNSDWMASVRNNSRLLSQLSIPGTHDTGSIYNQDFEHLLAPGLDPDLVAGGADAILSAWTLGTSVIPAAGIAEQVLMDYVYTQSMPLDQQLKAGIRYWDIRLAFTDPSHSASTPLDSSSLGVWHGNFNLSLDFDLQVMPTAVTFLQGHPNEALLMRIKAEDNTIPSTGNKDFSNFDKKLQSVLHKYSTFLYMKPSRTTWEPSQFYSAGDVVFDANGRFARAQNDGVTGPTAPDWNDQVASEAECTGHFMGTWDSSAATCTLPSSTTQDQCENHFGGVWNGTCVLRSLTDDGGVTWRNLGANDPKPCRTTWKPSWAYLAGDVVFDSNGNFQQAQNNGASGNTAPDWNEHVAYEAGCTGANGTWHASTSTCTLASATNQTDCQNASATWDGTSCILMNSLTQDGSVIWRNLGANDPPLANIRGKIVVVTTARVSYGIHGFGDGPNDTIARQEGVGDSEYSMDFLGDITRKWGLVRHHLDLANNRAPLDPTIYFGYTSATGIQGSTKVGGYPYFFASGHSNNETAAPRTDAPRLATGLTRGVIDTCADADWCNNHLELPSTVCFLGTCSVVYDGLNHMTLKYLTDPSFLAAGMPRQDPFHYPGIVASDFPGHGLIDSIIAANFAPNTPPVAKCKNVAVDADASCHATASIDDGSYDPDGTPPSCVQAPAGPYAVGTTAVMLTCTDFDGAPASCSGNVTVSDHASPSLTCPRVDVECTSNQSAIATFAPTVTDNCTAHPSTSCTPASGGSFPLGSTPVGCQTSDAAGNPGSCSFSVNVADTTPPAITCPAAQTVECTGSQHASASFSASSSDVCWGSLTPHCTPSSGSSFALGTTPVSCNATDGSGNPTTCGSQVTVEDTTPPSITCPAAQTVECTGNGHASPSFSASSSDVCWGALSPHCTPSSGSSFALGTTPISCDVTDGSGHPATCGSQVTVEDTTPPVITCPADIAVDPTSPAGTVVTFDAPATDVCDSTPQVACSPVSGTTFGVGTQTSVGCTATDASLNQASCSFGVKVFSPQEVIANLLSGATALGAGGTLNQGQTNSLQVQLGNILKKIDNGPTVAACGQLQGLASKLNEWVQDGTLTAADAQPMLTSIANLRATLGCS